MIVDAPGLLLGALLGAEVAAVGLAWRARVGRPLVALLAFALVDEVALALLHAFLFEGAPRPLAGWARLGWHVETLFVLGWPAALAWACGFGRQTTKLQKSSILQFGGSWLPGLYLGAVAFLALAYPPPRAFLRWFYLAWEVLCVALAWRGVWRGRRRAWGPADVALVALVSCETMVALVGPFASDPFTRWWIARAFYLGAWGAVIVLLARARRPA